MDKIITQVYSAIVFLVLLCPAMTLAKSVLVLDINGAIGPATYEYVKQGIETAEEQKAAALILQIDTPGGLDKSMRAIIKSILASKVPIISYVAPEGARAASAGTYILYASHVAAMAPATNLGAATPVQIGGGGGSPQPAKPLPTDKDTKQDKSKATQAVGTETSMEKKIKNDAVAYIKGLAELRGRNKEWAVQAVLEGASLPSSEALKLGVIDFMANDITELLQKVNNFSVKLKSQKVKIDTENSQVEFIEPDWRTQFLAIITDPSIAYILLLAGVYGLFFEFSNPGFVFPGVVGAICLLVGLYALHLLPVNYVGLALILLGIIFLFFEVFTAGFGVLGVGGIISFVVGSILLMEEGELFIIPWQVITIMAVINTSFFAFIIGFALRSRQRPVVSGREQLLGNRGVALESFKRKGYIQIEGERWQARSAEPIKKGQMVEVYEVKGLLLLVKTIE